MDILFKAVDETTRRRDVEEHIGVVGKSEKPESTAASDSKDPTLETKELN